MTIHIPEEWVAELEKLEAEEIRDRRIAIAVFALLALAACLAALGWLAWVHSWPVVIPEGLRDCLEWSAHNFNETGAAGFMRCLP